MIPNQAHPPFPNQAHPPFPNQAHPPFPDQAQVMIWSLDRQKKREKEELRNYFTLPLHLVLCIESIAPRMQPHASPESGTTSTASSRKSS
ncbi:hypothetical protein M8J75_004518 [Diaphorina citri]|nr:hypothetical protein M8J75_004518 [Diaphorina citri]